MELLFVPCFFAVYRCKQSRTDAESLKKSFNVFESLHKLSGLTTECNS